MGTLAAEQTLDMGRDGRVATEQAVGAKQPKVAWFCHRLGRRLGNVVLAVRRGFSIEAVEQAIELVLPEAKQLEVDTVLLEPPEFGGEQGLVPTGIERNAIIGETEGPCLRIGQMRQPNDWHVRKAKALGRDQPAMAGNQDAAIVNETRHVETKLCDRAGDLRNLLVGMRPGVRDVRQKPLDRPLLD
jgi:hypothetical protein